MKKLLTTILIISVSYAFAQDWTQQSDKLHYFTSEGKIEVTPDYNAVALYFAKTVDQTAATKLEAQLSSFNANTPANTSVMDMKGVMLLRNANVFGDFSSKAARDNFLEQYNRNGVQAYDMVPAFMVQDKQAWLTKRVMIKLKPGVNLDAIQNITSQYNTKFVRNVVGPDTYLLEVQDISKQFEFIQALQSQGVLEWGEPDFKMDLIKFEDPLYPDQWHLNNTGGSIDGFPLVADNDIDAPEAWTISTGNASVVVAVIDDGVEEHRDMSPLLPGFSPVNNGDGTPNSSGDHGQACAGLIGALHNDIDARGVAPGSSFFSVNIFESNTSNADVATGVRWAAEQGGAHITSNSWGYGSCSSNLVQAVTDAFNWSAANGRGGLGTVSLVASGNDYGTCVSFPANLPSVIAVGAVDGAGEISLYSNQGPTLDITAPSNTRNGSFGSFYHGIRTLDREGSAGYSSGTTTNSFGGTSAATPIAAGVAALILAVDPSLTKTQVEEVMYNSAKDLGAPGRDNTFGHGVVNAHDALLSLNQEPDTTPPTDPTSFAASQVEDTKLVLSWDASTDDRAVAGYRIFQNGSELTTTSSTSLTVLNLTPSTTYSFEIEAYDGAGNTSDRATTQATTAAPKPCEEATNDDFESGWGNWVDGGSDARRSINDQAYANSGVYTVRLRDDSSSSFIRTNTLNFEGVSRVQIEFSYIVVGFDNAGEGFFLEYSTNGGSSWSQIEEWNLTDEFQNNQRKFELIEFDATFTANTRFRFRNDASTNGDRVYLDDIIITSCTTIEEPDTEAPSTPTNVAASNVTDSSADITWSASTDNVAVTGYDVYVNGTLDGSTASTSYSLTGLSPETSYSVGVKAKDAAGNESGEGTTSLTTGAFVDSQAPTQPTNLSSSNETTTSADITWTASTDNVGVTGYNVYVDGTLNGTTASTSYSLTGLDPATTYSVAVEATDAAANTSTQASIDVTTLTPPDETAPSTPTNVAASNVTDSSADITWSASTDNVAVTGYDVYVNGTLDGSTASTSYSLTGLSPETSYSVGVKAKDAAGNESGEGTTSFTTGAFVDSQAPTQPTNLSSSNETTTSADITWTASTDNVGVTGYNVYVDGTLNGTTASTSYSLTGLDPATTYSVAVEATDAAANTSTQASIDVTTLTPPDETAPEAPTNVAASNVTDSSADITWTASTDNVGVTGYDVYVNGTLDGSTASTSYSLTGLSPETTYSVVVKAKDAAGNESAEGTTSFTTTQTQSCQEQVINSEDFESGWGIWNDGGSDARRSSRDSQYANSGVFSVRLRDNSTTSVMFTDNLDLSGFEQLQVSFTYVARSMDNPNEDFFLEISTDGGASYSVVEEWNQGDEFVNGPRYFEQVSFAGTFTSNTRLRFRCDASGNSDWIYIDDVEISGCGPSTAAPILNSSSDFDFSSTLDAEDEDVEIVLYPNPVVETLNISNLPADARVQIFNFGGQLIMDKKSQDQIDLGSLQEGLYFVRIIHDGEVSSYTISKK